ncbi:MAG TPA: zf-HC2 domain-containing protein [Myxococcales bacterium]|nr:zf-HC2 domain-containing protein [Myxococcales bacterium]
MKRRCEESVPLLGPWIDGELAAEDVAWLAEHAGCCEACSARKALLEAQRDAVREAVVARAASADLSGLADAVMARVREDRAPAPVVRLRVWGTETWRAHRTRISAAAGLAMAASLAAVALFSPPRTDPPATGPLLADARPPNATVEVIDFESPQGAVFQAGQTTVIWVDDGAPAVLR